VPSVSSDHLVVSSDLKSACPDVQNWHLGNISTVAIEARNLTLSFDVEASLSTHRSPATKSFDKLPAVRLAKVRGSEAAIVEPKVDLWRATARLPGRVRRRP